ncbi:MAG: hypothetical protein ACKO5Z_00700 [Burkholderiaceae bacterium]
MYQAVLAIELVDPVAVRKVSHASPLIARVTRHDAIYFCRR